MNGFIYYCTYFKGGITTNVISYGKKRHETDLTDSSHKLVCATLGQMLL